MSRGWRDSEEALANGSRSSRGEASHPSPEGVQSNKVLRDERLTGSGRCQVNPPRAETGGVGVKGQPRCRAIPSSNVAYGSSESQMAEGDRA